MCSKPSHNALNDLAASIATACISAALSAVPQTKIRAKAGVFQVGTISLLRMGLSVYSRIIYEWNVNGQGMG